MDKVIPKEEIAARKECAACHMRLGLICKVYHRPKDAPAYKDGICMSFTTIGPRPLRRERKEEE